ncbi:MAG: fatty acid desaturase [Moorea sp. SIOASIH]|uniref:fatty acid desaturase n=1 Tax=Moorena sp. SIOASIH TaxID=2607817 RepID=UPI0013BE5B82|nr:fatty acid desaturase [Moorena sp. SIOASIH]NEO41309.1 fatty acid desaturase [Moorena sp. SIOASIH]
MTVFAVHFSALFICQNPIYAGIVALALLLPQYKVSTIVHNQAHVAMFRGNIPNLILNIFLYLESGMMVSQFHLQHNCGYHCFYKDPEKDPSTLVKADGATMGRLEYVIHDIFVYTFDTIKIGKSYPHLLLQYYQKSVLNIILVATLLLFNPINGLILLLTSILIIRRIFIAFAYDYHVNIHSESDDYAASNSNTNPILNLFIFNG